ncbi:OmpL47-type beta-barrel domain-containing protein [Nocardioides rubriscoriae]|uniref:OmpL47-type beta-barrel domain-containing protein n=1 Tax=Nocardioides rubriscoriae TaxID=642762 RepID=UPI0011DF81E3|nr:Ig-like domain-containing protein [Nocardioides rubriscoriae]
MGHGLLRRGVLLGVVVLAVVTCTQPAWAFWRTTGLGSGTAVTATFSAPVVTVSGTAWSSTVHVAWTAATTSGGLAAQSYVVVRVDEADGSTAAACGTSAGSPTASLACDDPAVPTGTHRYVVTATQQSWTSTSTASAAFATDATAPSIVAGSVSPVANANGYQRTAPVTVPLTATDVGPAGVASISYRIDGGTVTTVAAATTSVSVSGDGTRVVTYAATDAAGNVSVIGSTTVRLDTTAPTVTVAKAGGQADPTNASTAQLTVTFSEAVTGFTSTDVVLSGVTGATAAVSGTGASYTVAISGMTGQGTLSVSVPAAAAVDVADNPNTASGTATVVRDTVAPTVAVSSFTRSGGNLTVTGTTSEPASVTVTFCRGTGLLFINLLPPIWGSCTETVVTVSSSNSWTAPATVSSTDAFAYYARAVPTDAAGNTGSAVVAGPVG